MWSDGKYQARVVQDPQSHFGLPTAEATDVRVIFNNGITQNVIHPKSGTTIEELHELKGSCPFVYGWDGQRFEMITDLLWNAPLGLQVARGQPLPDRRWEYCICFCRSLSSPRTTRSSCELQKNFGKWLTLII